MDLADEIIIVESGLSRENILSVVLQQPLVQLLCLGGSVWIDQLVECKGH